MEHPISSILSRNLLFLLAILGLGLPDCASAPSADQDLALAMAAKGSGSHVGVLQQQGERIAGTKFTGGNKVTLLRDGPATYKAMMAAIGAAKRRIDMESYIFDDDLGERFAGLLLAARARGVEVNLIYDSWGSSDTPPELFDRMREGDIHILEFHPVDDPGNVIDFSINSRDHRKLLIIDNKTVFVGGINIDGEEHHAPAGKIPPPETIDEDNIPWRDTDIRIDGPAAAAFESLFMQNWRDEDGEPPLSPPTAPAAAEGHMLVQALAETPGAHHSHIYRSLIVAMALAKSSIHMTEAFFVPTPSILHALENAARRGVDVKLVLPGIIDDPTAFKAGRAYYEDLMEAGVQIYERQGAVLHAKTAVIDGIWSTVGSSNLDWRSVLFNDEANAVILGGDFGGQMEAMFADDLRASKKIDPQEWKDRPFGDTVEEWFARIGEIFL